METTIKEQMAALNLRPMEQNSESLAHEILTDEEIAEGLTLACQAHPTTATIKIDFDDV